MPFTPAAVLFVWMFGLLSLALPVAGGWLLYEWYDRSHVLVEERVPVGAVERDATGGLVTDGPPLATQRTRRFQPDYGMNAATMMLAGGSLLVLLTFAGGPVLVRLILPRGNDDPKHSREGTTLRIQRPDGTELQVEQYGPDTGQPIVLTHGLGATSTQWYYAKRELGSNFRVIVWDLPGSGKSSKAQSGDYSLTRLAGDLEHVIRVAAEGSGGQPVLVVGHSLGGMIGLELAGNLPARGTPLPLHDVDNSATGVCGWVGAQTTYKNPLQTMKGASIYVPLQKPLIEPLLYVTIFLAPLVRLMNALSYFNGSAHLSSWWTGFKGRPSYGQVDFVASNYLYASPVTLGRLCLAMLQWDASESIRRIQQPTLLVPGSDDTTCMPVASEHMRTAIPQAQLQTLSPTRHLGILQEHQAFAASVAEFAQATSRRGTATGSVAPALPSDARGLRHSICW